MKRILLLIVTIAVMVTGLFAQNVQSKENPVRNETRTEIMAYLASLPDVSVAYLTKTMLDRLPKDRAESPLTVLIGNGGVQSIRVFKLGGAEAEAGGKKLINAYVSNVSEPNYAELLMLQNSISNEVIMYGFPIPNDTSYYSTALMYTKTGDKKAILIILTGKIHQNTIGELIDSFSK
ncbi:MAG: DUF4252 domain-containing protein [Muribaculum sp.]|nr:DUF4252 domain-containing protein [Muribaculum sp.]